MRPIASRSRNASGRIDAPPPSETADSVEYVAGIRRLFLGHGCVSCSFSPADERLALGWCRRGASLEQAEHAIYLGVARKYAALLNKGKGSPITALSYFEHLIADVAHAEVSPNYWRHVKDRTEEFERCWQTATRPKSAPTEEIMSLAHPRLHNHSLLRALFFTDVDQSVNIKLPASLTQ